MAEQELVIVFDENISFRIGNAFRGLLCLARLSRADDPRNRAGKPKAGGFRGPGQIREESPVTEMEFEGQRSARGPQEARNQEAEGSAGKTEGRSTG